MPLPTDTLSRPLEEWIRENLPSEFLGREVYWITDGASIAPDDELVAALGDSFTVTVVYPSGIGQESYRIIAYAAESTSDLASIATFDRGVVSFEKLPDEYLSIELAEIARTVRGATGDGCYDGRGRLRRPSPTREAQLVEAATGIELCSEVPSDATRINRPTCNGRWYRAGERSSDKSSFILATSGPDGSYRIKEILSQGRLRAPVPIRSATNRAFNRGTTDVTRLDLETAFADDAIVASLPRYRTRFYFLRSGVSVDLSLTRNQVEAIGAFVPSTCFPESMGSLESVTP